MTMTQLRSITVSLVLFFMISQVTSFTPEARLSIWPSSMYDEIGEQIEEFAASGNASKRSMTIPLFGKRSGANAPKFDMKDKRIGFSAIASLVQKEFLNDKKPTLGECTQFINGASRPKPMHVYKGTIETTYLTRAKSDYRRKTDYSQKYDYTKIMGGVSVSLFGLLGASVEATKTTTLERNEKSLLLYRHQKIHNGIASLTNAEVGNNWITCVQIQKHYYLRDILTGSESRLFVNLYFKSEEERERLQVKIKVNLLFFSITKTIETFKSSLSKDVRIKITYISSYPKSTESLEFYAVDKALESVTRFEKKMDENRNRMKEAKTADLVKDKNAHLTYFFMPCIIRNINSVIPLEPKKNTLFFELIERATEMKSVEQDVSALQSDNQKMGKCKAKLEAFKKDINDRLAKVVISASTIKNFNLGNLVRKLENLYGPDRAPYYYERQLKRISKNCLV